MGLLDLLFPRNCLECGRQGRYVCESCLAKVERGKAKFYKPQIGDFEVVYSLWSYEGVIRKVILALKYSFAYDIADELTEDCVSEIKYQRLNIKDCTLVPVPLHKRRQNWRGFNQSAIVGKKIASGLDWSFEENLLTANLASKTQVGLPKKERLQNIRGKYAVKRDIEVESYKGTEIILFDDVWTTGATMREAARILKIAGFKKIYGLTICG